MEKVPFAGRLDKVITVFKTETTIDSVSDHIETPVQVARPRAMLRDVSGSQEIEGAIQNRVNRSYTIRRYREIAENGRQMYIEHDGKKYRIDAIKEIERSHLELLVVDYE